MKAALLLLMAIPVLAHRLDEYLQATLIAIEKNHVELQIRMAPGVAVLPFVLASIDTDRDGIVSEPEQRAYAAQVLRDLSVSLNGDRLTARVTSMKFPAIEEMREGLGEIQLVLSAEAPGNGPGRKLVFENRHQSRISAYLVNCEVPRDPEIRILRQERNESQSLYRLDYVQTLGKQPVSIVLASCIVVLLLFARFAWLCRRWLFHSLRSASSG